MERALISQTPQKVGEKVKVAGWVHTRRDHGKLIFVDLRDRSGLLQVVFGEEVSELRPEWEIEVECEIVNRPAQMANPEIPTGAVELKATNLKILARAKTPPFPLDTDGYDICEEIRLKYRYLDLRRERLQKNIRTRHRVAQFIRRFLTDNDFIEIETPYITKGTPEGAREFIIPARLQKGKFYTLPQSPQQFKQLLMVAGFERYFQLARIFRDEDPRADRAYGEATQVDIEMSFMSQEEILELIEKMLAGLVKDIFPEKKITSVPFPRIPYDEAMQKYGSDKPDLR